MSVSDTAPQIFLARHCETEWSRTGRHTGLTDLPLTERGERDAVRLGERLRGMHFDRIFVSPLQRARRTCELAGFGDRAEIDHDLVEWDYGEYEGRRAAEIRVARPDWQVFRDGCPGGETPQQVAARADRVVQRLRDASAAVLVFSSGHFLRMLAARWLGRKPLEISLYLMLDAGSLSRLGYQADGRAVIWQWNETQYLEPKS